MTKLELKKISYFNKASYVLKDIDYTFDDNHFYVIVTDDNHRRDILFSLLGGIQKPTEGSILLDDRNISKIKNYIPNTISMILKSNPLIEHFTAMENIQEACHISKRIWDRRDIRKLFTSVNFNVKRLLTQVRYLSPMERIKIAIVRSIAIQSEFILVNEPSLLLNEDEEQELLELFQKVKLTYSLGIIVTTTSLEVPQYADRVVVLNTINHIDKLS